MFRACPVRFQEIWSARPRHACAKESSSYLPCGIRPFCFFHILIGRENAYLRRVLIAVVLIPGTQEPRNPGTGPHGRVSIPMLLSKNTADAADMPLAVFPVAGFTSDAMSCLDFGITQLFPAVEL